jgi:xanthine dehydrogenase YagS FAD-binding subunit
VALSAVIRDRVWKDVRIVLGGVATSPYRCIEAEAMVVNQTMSTELADAAAQAALKTAKPLRMNGYKVDLSKTLIRRALVSLEQQDSQPLE